VTGEYPPPSEPLEEPESPVPSDFDRNNAAPEGGVTASSATQERRDAPNVPPQTSRAFLITVQTLLEALGVVWAAAGVERVFASPHSPLRQTIWAIATLGGVFVLFLIRRRVHSWADDSSRSPVRPKKPLPELTLAQVLSFVFFLTATLFVAIARPPTINDRVQPEVISLLVVNIAIQARSLTRLTYAKWRPVSWEAADSIGESRFTTALGAQALFLPMAAAWERSFSLFVVLMVGLYAVQQWVILARQRAGRSTRYPHRSIVARILLSSGGMLFVAALAASTVATASAGAHLAHIPVDTIAAPASGLPGSQSASSGPLLPRIAPPVLARPQEPEPQPSFRTLCGSSPKSLPGSNIPDNNAWATKELFDLWLGERGLGATVAGCPSPARSVGNANDQVWYSAGYSDGSLESVGVASQTHGAVMFLDGGIAQFVLNDLESGIVVSGSPREDIGDGDLQLVYTPDGTTAFIRPTKHPTGEPYTPTSLTIVPPTGVTLLVEADEATGEFLWPTYLSGSYQTAATIALSPEPYGTPVAQITLSSSGQAAVTSSFLDASAQSPGPLFSESVFTELPGSVNSSHYQGRPTQ
jgi:hypothetical protein